jgi:hypothetical protein
MAVVRAPVHRAVRPPLRAGQRQSQQKQDSTDAAADYVACAKRQRLMPTIWCDASSPNTPACARQDETSSPISRSK